ncbi:MAG: recombination protein O N-terminal domain-containing protein [Bacteroidaceae bacterium]|nr:recombination protein O N-terminal domain-containing protein [Bacteroidaceae bacterium]
MQEKTQGVVLRTIRYGEAALIADVYTRSHGVLGFMVKVPKGRKSALRSVLFASLTMLELDFDYRETLKLQRVTDVRVWKPYETLPYQPVKQTIALFLSEFLYYSLRDEHYNEDLFSYLVGSMEWLDQCESGFTNFPLTFLIRLSRFLGIWPTEPEVAAQLRADEQHLVPLILRMDFATMHLFQFTSDQRARLYQVLNDYYRRHIPAFPELQSMVILREVLS